MSQYCKCSVPDCPNEATVEVILYDVYRDEGVFFERDFTCPFLCTRHMSLNEAAARGVREPRGFVRYPLTNRHSAAGFTIYRPLESLGAAAGCGPQAFQRHRYN